MKQKKREFFRRVGNFAPTSVRTQPLWSGRISHPPPTFRGVRVRGTKPRVELEPPTFHGCSVFGFGVRDCGFGVSSAGAAGASAAFAALARAAASFFSSLARQQCLYFFPEPQRQGSLRPGRARG